MKNSKPEVFIIESLRFDDEEEENYDGEIISKTLKLNKKRSEYYYIRTKKELRAVPKKFPDSNYRYLYLSCHANNKEMAGTLDSILFDELSTILKTYLREKDFLFQLVKWLILIWQTYFYPGLGVFR